MEKVLKRPYPRRELAQAFMLVGIGVLLAAFVLARLDRAPFATWFYSFAWWSYILIVDGWVYRQRGESLLISYPRRFAFLSLWSVVLWSFYELLNFRLQNWYYVGLPADLPVRWAGYVVAFATVVPALLETADLLDTGWHRPISVAPFMRSGRWVFGIVGVACMALPLLWPKMFFPLVWGALFFLLDPLNELLGGQSLLSDWRSGTLRRLTLLAMAGLLCGFLWEGWNVCASAHWMYHLPGLDRWKIFEMPVVGYLGFFPFALSVFTASVTATKVWEKSSGGVRATMGIAGVALCWALFAGIDRFTLLVP
jgi:hypothetical protein